MPYYVYAIKGFGMLDKLAEFVTFREASVHAKALRAQSADAASPPGLRIKVIFGENETAAEDALLQVRHAGPTGEE